MFIKCESATGKVNENDVISTIFIRLEDVSAFELVEDIDTFISASLKNGQILKMCTVKNYQQGTEFIDYVLSCDCVLDKTQIIDYKQILSRFED